MTLVADELFPDVPAINSARPKLPVPARGRRRVLWYRSCPVGEAAHSDEKLPRSRGPSRLAMRRAASVASGETPHTPKRARVTRWFGRSQGRRRALPRRCRTPLRRAEVVTRLRKGGERSGGWIAVRELLYFWEDAVSTGRARSPCRITREILVERDGEMVEERGRTDDVVPPAVKQRRRTRESKETGNAGPSHQRQRALRKGESWAARMAIPGWAERGRSGPSGAFILFLFILYFPSSIPKFNLNFEFQFKLVPILFLVHVVGFRIPTLEI
jgi:hypothetical protein